MQSIITTVGLEVADVGADNDGGGSFLSWVTINSNVPPTERYCMALPWLPGRKVVTVVVCIRL